MLAHAALDAGPPIVEETLNSLAFAYSVAYWTSGSSKDTITLPGSTESTKLRPQTHPVLFVFCVFVWGSNDVGE